MFKIQRNFVCRVFILFLFSIFFTQASTAFPNKDCRELLNKKPFQQQQHLGLFRLPSANDLNQTNYKKNQVLALSTHLLGSKNPFFMEEFSTQELGLIFDLFTKNLVNNQNDIDSVENFNKHYDEFLVLDAISLRGSKTTQFKIKYDSIHNRFSIYNNTNIKIDKSIPIRPNLYPDGLELGDVLQWFISSTDLNNAYRNAFLTLDYEAEILEKVILLVLTIKRTQYRIAFEQTHHIDNHMFRDILLKTDYAGDFHGLNTSWHYFTHKLHSDDLVMVLRFYNFKATSLRN